MKYRKKKKIKSYILVIKYFIELLCIIYMFMKKINKILFL